MISLSCEKSFESQNDEKYRRHVSNHSMILRHIDIHLALAGESLYSHLTQINSSRRGLNNAAKYLTKGYLWEAISHTVAVCFTHEGAAGAENTKDMRVIQTSKSKLNLPFWKSNTGQNGFSYLGPQIWKIVTFQSKICWKNFHNFKHQVKNNFSKTSKDMNHSPYIYC